MSSCTSHSDDALAHDEPHQVTESSSASEPPTQLSPPERTVDRKSRLRRTSEAVAAFYERYRLVIVAAALASATVVGTALFRAGDYAHPERVLTRGACVVVDQDAQGNVRATNVGCVALHNGEVMWDGPITDVSDTADASTVRDRAMSQCSTVFKNYVGRPVAESSLGLLFVPSDSTLPVADDRWVSCIVFDPRADHLTRPLRGAGV